MCACIAIVYNEPNLLRDDRTHEQKAVVGVLEAVEAVRTSIIELGYEVILLPLVPPFEEARGKLESLEVTLVFNLFEGFYDEPETEALVPEVLTKLGIPFTGCQAPVLKLGLDKAKVKVLLQKAGIPTADFQLLNPKTLHTFRLDYPCIVKPRADDASNGITADSVVDDFPSLARQVKVISGSYGGSALVERFIGGSEYNATVMGNSEFVVLPVSEIVYSLSPGLPRILNFEAKWDEESAYFRGTKVVCPAEIEPRERERIAETALAAYKLLGCSGYARVDMRMDEAGRLNVMEVNPNPDISPGTGAARQALAAGMNYTQFVERIIQLALEKKDYDRQYPPHGRRGQTGADANTPEYARI
jgi:D-alanine-D-alanine ligase